MPIPPMHAHRFVYHTTHLNNLEGILKHGFLSHGEQRRRGLVHHSIAEASIQARRAQMPVPCGPGGVVHDYVPLYFSKLSPMMLKLVQAKNVDQMFLLHFAFPISILDRADVIFTDEAANSNKHPRFFTDPADLVHLRWDAIDLRTWGSTVNGVDMKHQRMAEALVHVSLDSRQAAFVVVWNKPVREQVEAIYAKTGVPMPRFQDDGSFEENHSFTHFRKNLPSDMLRRSIASGPLWTRHRFDQTVAAIRGQQAGPYNPRFASLTSMLAALQTHGLGVLPETAELVGLESENEVHKHDVGTHTLNVVNELRESPEYAALGTNDRIIVETAAFIHDIGKGPRSRWAKCGGKQQVDADHPIRSMEMLPRILREETAVDDDTVRVLCMLVCYHDLVGDIIGRGRDSQQLIDIVENKRDLDMMIALGKADMTSVATSWGVEASFKLPALRAWAESQLSS